MEIQIIVETEIVSRGTKIEFQFREIELNISLNKFHGGHLIILWIIINTRWNITKYAIITKTITNA